MTQQSIAFQTPHAVAWDIETMAPELKVGLSGMLPHLDQYLAEFRQALPCANTINPFGTDAGTGAGACGYTRPYRHLRAFYRHVPGGVLAIKGTEPHALDRDSHLRMLAAFRVDYPSRGKSLFSAAEHFALVEQKIPLAVSLDEALEDVRCASAVQGRHLARFGQLARLPTPLLAVSWSEETRQRHLTALAPLLSERANKIVKLFTQNGLGAVVYFYPHIPLRVAHLATELGAKKGPWLGRLRTLADPADTIDRWIDLTARMLALGFLPGRTEHIGIGHCLEMQNAVIDGGFVDLGSVVAMDQITDESAFQEMLLAAFADLSNTIRHFLLGPVPDATAEYRNPSLAMMQTLYRVIPTLLERIASYQPSDSRLLRAITPIDSFETLVEELSQLVPDSASVGEHA